MELIVKSKLKKPYWNMTKIHAAIAIIALIYFLSNQFLGGLLDGMIDVWTDGQ
jgi:hypothetical protein